MLPASPPRDVLGRASLRRSALKSVHWTDLSGKPVGPHPHMIHRHDDRTEEWMAFFKDNEGRPLGIMSQVKS
jgi:hypothetical protein